ncbi:formate/nitrite transporter family protein [Yersinia enterocolitica]|uniref:formate/nitrite transporter family protein n=1 Tax=Yersinia enterocolitica TaxID=630 RepID=UPI0005E2F5F5|nr:formate/nitrite transporter family protein [Yersinia enterocolitica]CQJ28727.1 putative inner membrane protein [Yersinia enterocolitica]
MSNEKRSQDKGELTVESDEPREEQEIEVNEKKLPSKAAAIHEIIRVDGEKELERDSFALLWSAVAAGLSMGASLIAKGIFHAKLPETPASFLLENIGYTFGFIIVIMARQQLFTENTVTPVLPIMQKPSRQNFILLFRLWGLVLLGNLIGTGIAAYSFIHMPVFDNATRAAFVTIAQGVMESSAGEMFAKGIFSGWIIATMVWMMPSAGGAKIWVIFLMTYLVALCDLTHIVVGSVEIFYLVFNGSIPWQQFIYPFAIPTLAGNIIGGTFFFALISHAQIRSDMAHQPKKSEKVDSDSPPPHS